jgi:hypothetical protein
LVTLGQYGSDNERALLDSAASEPVWAESDPLVDHLAGTDWLSRREGKPREALEAELVHIVGMPDEDRRLRRIAAYELALHAGGSWRVLARAVLADRAGQR